MEQIIQDNRRQSIVIDRHSYCFMFADSIQNQYLSKQSKKGILQILSYCSIMGNIEYTQELIDLIFPFLKITQYKELDIIEPFVDSYQFRCLLSGNVYKFSKYLGQKNLTKSETQKSSDPIIKQLQQRHQAKFIRSIEDPFQTIQNNSFIYITSANCQILTLELDQFTKDIVENKFDRMRLYFIKHFGNLVKDRSQLHRQLQYFKRQNKKFKQDIIVNSKLYFIDEGAVQIFIDENVLPLEMQKGSIVGIQQFFSGENRKQFFYRVKSLRLSVYSIKLSNVGRLGQEWIEYLENSAKSQKKIWSDVYDNKQRKMNLMNKVSRSDLIKANYQIRQKTLSVQNDMMKVFDKMHCMQQGIVVNYKISQHIKNQLPKIDGLDILITKLNQKRQTTKFNPYKQIRYSNYQKKQPKRKRFDELIKIQMRKNYVQSLRTSPQRINQQNKYCRTFTKFELKPFKKQLLKHFSNTSYQNKFL